MSLKESRVRDIMECWGRAIDMQRVSRSEIVELCKAWLASHHPQGVCEHGIVDGDWCKDCYREYKEAMNDQDNA